MIKLSITLLIITGLLLAGTTLAARFDWSLGEPVITDDNDNTTNGTRYDWVLGQPAIVWDEPTAAAATQVLRFKGGVRIKGGVRGL